jgi:hypothetical protein
MGVLTSTEKVPSAPDVLKAVQCAAQIGFWYHLTRIFALEAPCSAFYEARRPPVVNPTPPAARHRCSAAQLQLVLPVALAFALG